MQITLPGLGTGVPPRTPKRIKNLPATCYGRGRAIAKRGEIVGIARKKGRGAGDLGGPSWPPRCSPQTGIRIPAKPLGTFPPQSGRERRKLFPREYPSTTVE